MSNNVSCPLSESRNGYVVDGVSALTEMVKIRKRSSKYLKYEEIYCSYTKLYININPTK